jgi:HAE1 family hydrophobic/amphiphilic exporter-1
MTALSFILGVIPLLIASGAGSASRQILGTAVFGGMLAATALSLIVVPMMYFVIQTVVEKISGGEPSTKSMRNEAAAE